MLLYRSLGVTPRRASRPSPEDRDRPDVAPENERQREDQTPAPVVNRRPTDNRS